MADSERNSDGADRRRRAPASDLARSPSSSRTLPIGNRRRKPAGSGKRVDRSGQEHTAQPEKDREEAAKAPQKRGAPARLTSFAEAGPIRPGRVPLPSVSEMGALTESPWDAEGETVADPGGEEDWGDLVGGGSTLLEVVPRKADDEALDDPDPPTLAPRVRPNAVAALPHEARQRPSTGTRTMDPAPPGDGSMPVSLSPPLMGEGSGGSVETRSIAEVGYPNAPEPSGRPASIPTERAEDLGTLEDPLVQQRSWQAISRALEGQDSSTGGGGAMPPVRQTPIREGMDVRVDSTLPALILEAPVEDLELPSLREPMPSQRSHTEPELPPSVRPGTPSEVETEAGTRPIGDPVLGSGSDEYQPTLRSENPASPADLMRGPADHRYPGPGESSSVETLTSNARRSGKGEEPQGKRTGDPAGTTELVGDLLGPGIEKNYEDATPVDLRAEDVPASGVLSFPPSIGDDLLGKPVEETDGATRLISSHLSSRASGLGREGGPDRASSSLDGVRLDTGDGPFDSRVEPFFPSWKDQAPSEALIRPLDPQSEPSLEPQPVALGGVGEAEDEESILGFLVDPVEDLDSNEGLAPDSTVAAPGALAGLSADVVIDDDFDVGPEIVRGRMVSPPPTATDGPSEVRRALAAPVSRGPWSTPSWGPPTGERNAEALLRPMAPHEAAEETDSGLEVMLDSGPISMPGDALAPPELDEGWLHPAHSEKELLVEGVEDTRALPQVLGDTIRLRVAPLARRLGALAIDGSIAIVVAVLAANVRPLARQAMPSSWEPDLWILALADRSLGPALAIGAICAALFSGFLEGMLGRTLGKLAFGLKLVRVSTGGRVGLMMSLFRSLLSVLSLAALGAGFAWVLVDRRCRAWHDIFSGTVVVRSGELS